MDRARRILSRALIAALATALAGCSSAPVDTGPQEADWFAPGADIAHALSNEPPRCVTDGPDQIRHGELLFNSPFLLGGQAAKAGISCASCHENGRANPNFFFAGLSGEPGTADTTHGFFGPARDDGVFNPVSIPDLASPEGHQLVDRDDAAALSDFLESQIVEEFEGARPGPDIVAALSAYLRALDMRACEGNASASPETWRGPLSMAVDAVLAAEESTGDTQTAYRRAARHFLRRIHDRFPHARDAGLRAALVDASQLIAAGETLQAIEQIEALRTTLQASEHRSLYDLKTLQARYGQG
ncbi:MAG: hypothetical protein AAFW65_03045 [Pseudomonadota bacterium]